MLKPPLFLLPPPPLLTRLTRHWPLLLLLLLLPLALLQLLPELPPLLPPQLMPQPMPRPLILLHRFLLNLQSKQLTLPRFWLSMAFLLHRRQAASLRCGCDRAAARRGRLEDHPAVGHAAT